MSKDAFDIRQQMFRVGSSRSYELREEGKKHATG
jgi:hypothetical protein